MIDVMETLVDNDYTITENTDEAATYAKQTADGGTEEYTMLVNEGRAIHERYNKNGTQVFSESITLKTPAQIGMLIRSIK